MMPPENKKICQHPEWKFSKQDDGSLDIEGWISTNDLDDGNDIVQPEAFRPVIGKYLQKPIVLFMHRFMDLPIGRTLSLSIKEKGLWGKIKIVATEMGKDIIKLIEEKILNSFSFAFDIKKYEMDDETGTRTIIELSELYEISVVNLGMNWNAVFDAAKAKNIELKSLTPNLPNQGGGIIRKGVSKMDPNELKERIDSELSPVKGDMSKMEAKVAEVKEEVGKVATLQSEIKQMKESADRTAAETRQFIERISSDFQKALDTLNESIKGANQAKVQYGTGSSNGIGLQKALELPEDRLKRVLREESFASVDEFRMLNDGFLLADQIKMAAAAKSGLPYLGMPLAERYKTFERWDELQQLAGQMKAAVDTSTSGEGSEYLPTAYSSRLIDLVRLENVVAAQHVTFPMTQSSQVNPVEGSDTIAIRATETTAIVSAFKTASQTPGSANKTFTAEKLWGRTQWSGEADDDLIISMTPYLQMKLARSFVRAIENATISGDDAAGTGFDTGDVPGSTDARYCWNGFRQECLSTSKIDLSTFTEKNLNKIRSKGGKYFKSPNDFYWLTSLTVVLLHFLDADEVPSVRTIDKYGPQATIATGELAKYMASPLLVSEYVLDTYNTAGIYDGTTMTKSIVLAVNRASHMYGEWKGLVTEIVRDPLNDVYDIVGKRRLDFKCVFDATAEPVVALGYNVSTS